jgi:hypothetical protein
MRIPKYWAKAAYTGRDLRGKERTFRAWGWSSKSLDAAKDDAAVRARKIFDALTQGRRPESYDYFTAPLREEITHTVAHANEEIALITRNRYGALVLNTAGVCFADIDIPKLRPHGVLDAVRMIFSKRYKHQRVSSLGASILESVRAWAQRNERRSFRLYRTCAGLRLLFTDRFYVPTSKETVELFKGLGCDPLYCKLTEKQQCFRARLTPKPWRCGCPKPPNRYPWENPQAEGEYRRWQSDYERRCQGYATCQLVETFGKQPLDEHIRTVVELHDRYACGQPTDTLA